MEMPKPTDAHRKLAVMEGTWIGEEKMPPSQWDPAGGTATGRIVNRVALDGFALIQDYEQSRGGKASFFGHGVFGWDAAKNEYVLHWFDSMGMGVNEYRGGERDGVFSYSATMGPFRSRVKFDFSKAGTYSFRMEMSADGESWKTMMEGSYRREG